MIILGPGAGPPCLNLNKGHMNKLFPLFLALLFLARFPCQGQEPSDSLLLAIRPYGSFRGHFAIYNDEIEIQENGSRIGVELSVTQGNVRYFAATELGINMFRSNVVFNADASTRGGFVVIESDQQNQVFSTRLGFLGVDLGPMGTLTLGKQWSVFYDITGYTDKFNVFGGQASATYVGGTDGGTTGTGRADQSLIYRNAFGPVRIGAQLQMRTVANDRFIDGLAFSGQFSPLRGLNLGAAYNRSFFNDLLKETTIGFGGDPSYFSAGASFSNPSWDIGLVFVSQSNGDVVESFIAQQEEAAVVFDARGMEAFIRFKLPKFAFLGGFNGYYPDTEDLPIYQGFKTEYYVLGMEFKPLAHAYFYAEYRLSQGRSSNGLSQFDVFTLGLRFDLERTWSRAFPVN